LLFDQNLCWGDLSLNFGLAAKAPKRDGCHRCHYPNLANTNYVSMGR
jgi:hypothetical protein